MMMNDDGDTGDEDVWTSKKKPILSSFLACVQLHNGHLDGPPSSNAPLTYTGDLQRESTRDISGHQDLLANRLPVRSGEVDLLLGALWGRRSRTPCEEALSYPSSLASHHSTHFSLLPGKPHPLPSQVFAHWVSFPALTCSPPGRSSCPCTSQMTCVAELGRGMLKHLFSLDCKPCRESSANALLISIGRAQEHAIAGACVTT